MMPTMESLIKMNFYPLEQPARRRGRGRGRHGRGAGHRRQRELQDEEPVD